MGATKTTFIVCTIALLGLATSALPRESAVGRTTARTASATPAYCLAEHNAGKLVLSVTNNGTFGSGYRFTTATDCFTGVEAHSCEYPKGSQTTYLYASALWIGAVVNGDTLVSVGADGWNSDVAEMHPDEPPIGNMAYRTTSGWCLPENGGAASEQDYIAVCTDTFTYGVLGLEPDYMSGRPHTPLHIEITCASHAWSRQELEDFVILDYTLRNIGNDTLSEVYVGLFADGDVFGPGPYSGFADDVSGLLRKTAADYLPGSCPADSDLLNLAYIADNDGDLSTGYSLPDVTGILFLRTPAGASDVSFNWWVSNGLDTAGDFGPQRRLSYRDFGPYGGTGTPEGDANKYFVLRNGDVDFDQVFTAAIGTADSIWLPANPTAAENITAGGDTRCMLSAGGFTLLPGDSAKFTVAYVGGENLHTQQPNIANLPNNPEAYLANLDFSDLITNARWAQWIFDSPGFDTDGDGYAGEFRLCDGDTVWTAGDGIPDFAGDGPPTAPTVRATPLLEAVKVQWNGYQAQVFREPLFGLSDFEGFSVYVTTLSDGTPGSFARLASFDVEDFRKYVWDANLSDWRLDRRRFMLSELLCLYAPQGCSDVQWHPLQFPRQAPFVWSAAPDSVFYFEQIGTNACQFGIETPILRSYPDAPLPPYQSPADVPADSVSAYLTARGEFKFYEYELTISNLLPEQEYLVSVSAFDHGPLVPDYMPLETCPITNAVAITPMADCCDDPTRGNLDNSPDGRVTMGDLADMIEHLFITIAPLECPEAGNLDLSDDGLMTMGDLTTMIDHLFISLSPLPPCP